MPNQKKKELKTAIFRNLGIITDILKNMLPILQMTKNFSIIFCPICDCNLTQYVSAIRQETNWLGFILLLQTMLNLLRFSLIFQVLFLLINIFSNLI